MQITTEICKQAIADWFAENGREMPGPFKRTKKFKNAAGEWVRLFEHAASGTRLQVTENGASQNLVVAFAGTQVGKGYLFAFCESETYEDAVGFAVVEQAFFEKHGHLDSVHFTTDHEMPDGFNEEMESIFCVSDRTEDEVRMILVELGFVESAELLAMLEPESPAPRPGL